MECIINSSCYQIQRKLVSNIKCILIRWVGFLSVSDICSPVLLIATSIHGSLSVLFPNFFFFMDISLFAYMSEVGMEVQTVLSQILSSHFYHHFSKLTDGLLVFCYNYFSTDYIRTVGKNVHKV